MASTSTHMYTWGDVFIAPRDMCPSLISGGPIKSGKKWLRSVPLFIDPPDIFNFFDSIFFIVYHTYYYKITISISEFLKPTKKSTFIILWNDKKRI